MRLRWTAPAADDLEQINDYLRERHPRFAASTIQALYDAAKSLKAAPYKGRAGSKAGTRELVLSRLPYVIVYWIKDDTVEILHVWHGAQKRD